MLLASVFSLICSFTLGASQASAVPLQAQSVRQSVTFDVWQESGAGNETFYSCDGLDDLTTNILKTLGATRISVDCFGGIDDHGYWGSPSITAKFTAPEIGTGAGAQPGFFQAVTLRGNDNCAAAQAIFEGVKDKFSILSATGTDLFCESYQGYRIEARVLKVK